jgi:hypothetical protein
MLMSRALPGETEVRNILNHQVPDTLATLPLPDKFVFERISLSVLVGLAGH